MSAPEETQHYAKMITVPESALATAREEGRRKGLEEARKLDIAAAVQKWKPLIEALGYRCLTGSDEDATVLTIMSGEQVVGCASLHGDGELSHYVDAKKIASALSTAREAGRQEGLEEAAKYADGSGSRHAEASNNLHAEGRKDAARLSAYASRAIYGMAEAIRALKEKQP